MQKKKKKRKRKKRTTKQTDIKNFVKTVYQI